MIGKPRDPILRLSNSMKADGIWDQEQEAQLNKELDMKIESAWDKAMNDPYPDKNATLDYVYAQD